MEEETGRRKAQSLGHGGVIKYQTLRSPEQQQEQQQQQQHLQFQPLPPQHEEQPHFVVETKSVPAEAGDGGVEEGEEQVLFWSINQEEKNDESQVRDGSAAAARGDEQYHTIFTDPDGDHEGLGIYIVDNPETTAEVENSLRDGEDDKPFHIFHGHGKQSQEMDATGNYGDNSGVTSPPQPGSGTTNDLSPEESFLRDILKEVKKAGDMANEQIHKKKAQEQDGKNDPWRAPQNFAFYNGEDDFDSNGGEPIETPRVPGQPTNQPTVFGKKNCKANSGSFGDIRQQRAGKGVTMKVRYELNVNTGAPYERTSLYNEILPNLEDATTTMLLPAFFSDECMKISITGSSSRRKRGRYLRGGGNVEENEDLDILFNEMEEQDSSFGYQHQHRRLNRVIGIDSDPMDFPLNGEACSGKYVPPNPTIVPKCYVMEGALTVYFPENYDYKKLLPSSQLLVLNTLKEGMEFGTMAQMAHPAILGLTFLDSSYSLRPITPNGDGGDSLQAVPVPSSGGGMGGIGLIAGVIAVMLVFVIGAGCFFKRRLNQEQAKLEAMMKMRLDDDGPKKKKGKKKKKKGGHDDDTHTDDSEGTPLDPASLALLNKHHEDDSDYADDEDNLTDREREIHQKLRQRRKSAKKKRRASMHEGSFSTIDTDSTNSDLRNSIGNSILTASETIGSMSKTTTSSDSTDDSGSESSTTSHSNTFHTTSTGTSDGTTTESDTEGGTTSSTTTSDDDSDDSEEDDAFDMNDDHFNVGIGNNLTNGRMKGNTRKKKGQRSNLIMTGDDGDESAAPSVGDFSEATEVMGNLRSRGGGFAGGASAAPSMGEFSGGASAAPSVDFSAATEAMGNLRGRGGGGFSGGASAAPSVDFSAATEAMGNLRGRSGGGFSGGASAAPSVDFSAATEAMGNLRSRGGGGFAGGASAAPSVDFSAATEAMGNLRGRGRPGRGGGASAAPSVDFSAATEAMGNTRKGRRGGSAGPGASVAMSAATEAIKNTGRKKAQPESVGDLTFSDF